MSIMESEMSPQYRPMKHPGSIYMRERCSGPISGPYNQAHDLDEPLIVGQADVIAAELDALWVALPEDVRANWKSHMADFNGIPYRLHERRYQPLTPPGM